MRQLYPPIDPYDSGLLDVGDENRIYWEVCGNPAGRPAAVVHGGPGSGSNPDHRRLFNPTAYRIVLFDQRGCGRSEPHASDLRVGFDDNSTAHLITDMERLREHLGIDRWLLCGGSWGSALSLAYAQTHPGRVSALLLRGVLTMRRAEIEWYYREGASLLFPDLWERFVEPIPTAERGDLLAAYGRRLSDPDSRIRLEATKAWSEWEGGTVTLRPDIRWGRYPGVPDYLVAFARIENHYFRHAGFLDEGRLIREVARIRHIPGVIIQGRYDVCTPAVTAWDLHRAWPESELRLVDDAGHAYTEPGILHELINATDRLARP